MQDDIGFREINPATDTVLIAASEKQHGGSSRRRQHAVWVHASSARCPFLIWRLPTPIAPPNLQLRLREMAGDSRTLLAREARRHPRSNSLGRMRGSAVEKHRDDAGRADHAPPPSDAPGDGSAYIRPMAGPCFGVSP
jgi:hypothetical protein